MPPVITPVARTDLLATFGPRRTWVEAAPGAGALQAALSRALSVAPSSSEGQYTAIVAAMAQGTGLPVAALRSRWASSEGLEQVIATAIERPERLDTTVQLAYRPPPGLVDSASLRAVWLQFVAEALAELDGVVGANPIYGSWADFAARYDASTGLLALVWSPPADAPLATIPSPRRPRGDATGAMAVVVGVAGALLLRRRMGRK